MIIMMMAISITVITRRPLPPGPAAAARPPRSRGTGEYICHFSEVCRYAL